MSKMTFIPAAAPAKPAQELNIPSAFKSKAETGVDSFKQFLKDANAKQLKTDRSLEKFERVRSGENQAKPEPKKDELKTAEQNHPDEVRPKSKPEQEVKADGTGEKPPVTEAEEEVTAEGQKEKGQTGETQEAVNQEELLALLAHLAEAEAVIRGETQPEAVQMAELSEVMAGAEPVGAVVAYENGAPGLNPGELGTMANVDHAEPNQENTIEDKSFDLSQLNQVVSPVSENAAREEKSLANQGENSGTKEGITESIKIAQAKAVGVEGGQTFAQTFSVEDHRSQPVGAVTQPGENRILAQQDQSSKDGKVNLAVIQTHLAVNDQPETQAEMAVLNLIPSQPTLSNTVSIETSGTTGANPANREELFAQLVEHAKVVVNNGGSEMEIHLRPEHLGKVQLKVSIENEVVTAKFVAESQQVKEIIESNLGQLKRDMQDSGMQVESIMVSVGQQQSSESFEQMANRQEGFARFNGSNGKDEEELSPIAEEARPALRSDAVIDLIA